jgi:hypothetical protein
MALWGHVPIGDFKENPGSSNARIPGSSDGLQAKGATHLGEIDELEQIIWYDFTVSLGFRGLRTSPLQRRSAS